MMGILILFCGIAGLSLSGMLGTASIALQRKAIATGGGSWLLFCLITVAVAAVVASLGVMYLLRGQSTPPKADDFTNIMKAMFLLGTAPGIGLLAGLLNTLFTD